MSRLVSLMCTALLALLLLSCRNVETVSPTFNNKMTPSAHSRSVLTSTLPLKEIWRQRIGAAFTSVPLAVTAENKIVIPISDAYTTTLLAVGLADGHIVWKQDLTDPQFPDRRGALVDSLFADSERVYAVLPFGVMAFDLTSGQPIWTSKRLPEHTSYYISPLVETNTLQVFGIYSDTHIYNINSRSGQIRSIEEYQDELLWATPMTNYVLQNLDLLRIDKNSNQIVWKVKTRGSVGDNRWPLFSDATTMIFLTGPRLGAIKALDLESGKTLWETPEIIASNLTRFAKNIYALTSTGMLVAFNEFTGESVGSQQFSEGPLDTEHASEYGVFAWNDTLLIYLGDSQELIAFSIK